MKKSFDVFRNVTNVSPSVSEMNNILENWNISNEVESVPITDVINSKNKNHFKMLYASKTKKPIFRAFRMPYIGLDTFFLQDIYSNTPAGRVVDFISYLISGGGFKPILKSRRVNLNPKEQLKIKEETEKIDKKHSIISTLIEIDNSIGNGNNPEYEHTLFQKIDGLLKMALVYGKGMNIRIANGKTYDLYPIHPRDIVYNIVDDNWKLSSIITTLSDTPYTMDQVIYAEWNPENPIYNIMYNGYSFMQRMLDSARALRRIKGTDLQIIAQKRWAGSAIIAMTKRDGKSDAKKLMDRLDSGKIYASEETDPEKAYHVHEIPLTRGTESIIEMATWLTHDIISLGGIPTTLFYDESSANHAVFDIRIRAFQKQIEEEFRSWAGEIISKQWYMRNFYDLFKNTKVYENYKIECEFIPIDFSSLEEKAKAITLINDIFPITPEFVGERLKIDNFISKIITKKSPVK